MPTFPAARTPCPNREVLAKYLRDELARSAVGAIENHVAACAGCQRALHELIGSAPGSVVPLPGAHDGGEEPPVLPGHTVTGRIDAGGMGVVWRARDLEFQRTLAVKVLKSGIGHNPRTVRRFLNEARITGGLAHPFIVPVHARGRLADGRPYFTMKLIEGETLAARLRRRPDRAAGQRELVRIFAQVCQAVAYAHSCGVIHRDLKPANIMVGAFGEVQVMDWGLAKVLSEPDSTYSADSTPPPTDGEGPTPSHPEGMTRCDPDENTRPGAVLGTYQYMPPEQARGEVERLDPRCDVFNLGAILCEILTGEPPYGFGSSAEVFARAAGGALAGAVARLDASGANAELVLLAKTCLAANREDRPANAGAVAWAVTSYEAGAEARLRRAEVEGAEAQVRAREERKRRRLASGLAAVVLVGLAGAAVSAVLLGQKNRQLAETNDQLGSARTEAVTKGEQAARARDRALQALDSLTSSVTGASLETQPAITTEQKRFLTDVLGYYQELASERGEDEETRERVAAAALRVGLINYRLGFHEAGRRAFERARAGFENLAADFPSVPRHRRALAESCNNLGFLLYELGKSVDAEAALRQALALREKLVAELPADPQHRRSLAGCYNNLARLLDEAPQRSDEGIETDRKALAIREKLAVEFPEPGYRQDLAASHNNLGTHLERLRRWGEAEEAYRKALAVREKLVAEHTNVPEYRQDLAASQFNLAGLLHKLPDRDKRSGAEETFRRALAIREKLAAEYPVVLKYRQDLAASYASLGLLLVELRKRPDEVQVVYQKALAIREKLAAEYPNVPEYRRELGATYLNLGTLHRKRNDHPGAEEAYKQALAVLEQLSLEPSAVPRDRYTLAGTHNNLGRLFGERNKPVEAEAAYRKALVIREKLAAEYPRVPEYREGLAAGLLNLADLLDDRAGRSEEAKAAYLRAQALYEQLMTDFPAVPEHRQDLAACSNNLGVLLRKMGQPAAAKAAYQKGLTLLEKLSADFPDVSEYRMKMAAGQVNFGNLLSRDGEFTPALDWYDRAIDALKPLVKPGTDPSIARQFLRTAHWGRAEALDNLDRPADAIADWDRAVELSPAQEKPMVRAVRARSLVRAGKVDRGVAEADELAKPAALPVPQLYTLARVYALAADRDEPNRDGHIRSAVRMLRRAVERGFKGAEQLKTDDDLKPLRDNEDFRTLLANLENSPKKEPGGKEK
jgi:serine/threonine protein kinase